MEGFTPWPPEFAEQYRKAGYWQDRVLSDYLNDWSRQWRDRPALIEGRQIFSYTDLHRAVEGLAGQLQKAGVAPGERFVLQLNNTASFVVLVFALFRIGAMPVMALPAHRRHEISYLLDFAGASGYAAPAKAGDFDFQDMIHELKAENPQLRHILIEGEDVDKAFSDLPRVIETGLAEAPDSAALDAHRPEPDDVALFLLSGGTTGLPKLIPRTHNDYAYNVRQSAETCEFDKQTIYLVALPASHNFPFGCPGILGTLNNGGCVVMAPSPRPEIALPLIAEHKVSVTAVVPAIAISWMKACEEGNYDVASLDLLQVGGARFNPEAAKRVRPVLGCTLQQVFGMAEGLLNYTRRRDPDEVIEHTQGRPMCEDDEILIVDDNGAPVADGEAGELLTRGPYTIRGYYKAEEQNRRAFTRDGYYRTGDVVRLHPSGNLMVEGREKDLINRGGEKISAEEIENLILGHEAVKNVAAVAMPDDVLGERICVYVVPEKDAALDLESLIDYLNRRDIARFKLPERLEIADDLPLTNIGKVDKKKLRDDIAGKIRNEGDR